MCCLQIPEGLRAVSLLHFWFSLWPPHLRLSKSCLRSFNIFAAIFITPFSIKGGTRTHLLPGNCLMILSSAERDVAEGHMLLPRLHPQTQQLPGPPSFLQLSGPGRSHPSLPVTWMSGYTAPVPPGGGCSPDPSVPCHCLKGSGPEPPSNTSLRPPGPQTLFLVSAFTVLALGFVDGENRFAETALKYNTTLSRRGTETSPHLPQCACFSFGNGALRTTGYLKEKGLPLQRQKLHRDMAGVDASI